MRQWLTQLAETAATVLVATHSAALLDSTSELINRVLILRDAEGTHLRRMTGALGAELAAVSGYLRLSKGELLLMTRLALFVEGPHDQWGTKASGYSATPPGTTRDLPLREGRVCRLRRDPWVLGK